jgi:hypothetical protein
MKLSCEEFEKNYPKCTTCSQGKLVTVEENKRKYIFRNTSSKRICKIQIDGCAISNSSSKKCDYLIVVCEPQGGDLYFIELKGKDLIRAVEQLTETIQHFKSEIAGKVFARVVVSRVLIPKTLETDARVKRLRSLLKKYSGNFDYKSKQYDKDKI